MIAEMRSYGQGVIISEQIPSKIAPDIIKNSSNKIIHRIAAKDDQEIIANMIGMDGKNALYLGDQVMGRALCHTEGMRLPVSVAFPKVTGIDRKDGELRRLAISNDEQNVYLLKSLVLPCLMKIDDKIPGLINTFMTFNESSIKEAINIIKKEANSEIKLNEPRLLKEARYDEVEAVIISELIIKYLFSGIYYAERLPANVFENIRTAILNPYDKPVKNLIATFSEIDNKNDMVFHVVTEFALNYIYTHKDQKIDKNKLIHSFFLKTDENIVNKIIGRINDRTGKAYG
jgi:hypothetical protein